MMMIENIGITTLFHRIEKGAVEERNNIHMKNPLQENSVSIKGYCLLPLKKVFSYSGFLPALLESSHQVITNQKRQVESRDKSEKQRPQ